MRDETVEWIDKAEGDLRTAEREFRVIKLPNFDAVCFHSQQCAEKYLKARMIERGLSISRTHDLEALLNLLLPAEPQLVTLRQAARHLSDMAVEVRYPGISADREDAKEALHAAETIRAAVRTAFGVEI
jgi:HEPN domain-containing protein